MPDEREIVFKSNLRGARPGQKARRFFGTVLSFTDYPVMAYEARVMDNYAGIVTAYVYDNRVRAQFYANTGCNVKGDDFGWLELVDDPSPLPPGRLFEEHT